MRYLKTNTATTITVGPFLDKTDGITPETSITVTGIHITFMVDNAGTPTLAIDADATSSGGNNDMAHVTNDDAGYYTLELTAANTNYLGGALLSLNVVGTACPVFHEFTILPANIYDSMIAGTDLFDVSTTQFNGSAVTASSGRPEVNMTHIAGSSVSTSTAQLGVNVVNFGGSAGTFASGRPEVNTTHAAGTAWGSGAITAGSIASSAITSAKFAAGAIDAAAIADGAIDLATFAADAKALMGVIAFGTLQAVTNTTAQLASGETFADDELIGATILFRTATTGAGQSRVITDSVGATDTVTFDALTTTPTGTVTYVIFSTSPASTSSPIAANVTQWNGSAVATPSVAGVPEVDVTHFNGTAGTFASGIPEVKVASLAAGAITAAAVATGAIDADALAADAVAEIADGVWDEALAGHAGAGSAGEALSAAGTAGDPWTTSLPGSYTGSQAGKMLSDILTDTAEIGAAGAGLTVIATQASVNTIDDFLDTEIAAIKAKTDQLTFTVANKVDANVKSVNDVTVTGTGALGDEWGP